MFFLEFRVYFFSFTGPARCQLKVSNKGVAWKAWEARRVRCMCHAWPLKLKQPLSSGPSAFVRKYLGLCLEGVVEIAGSCYITLGPL